VDVSVNWTVRGFIPDTGEPVKLATGADPEELTTTDPVVDEVPPVFVTVRVTV
jgi:hypothetical protein